MTSIVDAIQHIDGGYGRWKILKGGSRIQQTLRTRERFTKESKLYGGEQTLLRRVNFTEEIKLYGGEQALLRRVKCFSYSQIIVVLTVIVYSLFLTFLLFRP